VGWQRLPDNPEVEVEQLRRGRVHYPPARSKPRRREERAVRRRQRRGRARALGELHAPIAAGRLKQRDKVLERVGRLKARYPKACPFGTSTVAARGSALRHRSWGVEKFKAALAADGAYLLRSNRGGWTAREFRETYIQRRVVGHASGVLKSPLLLRPVWHPDSGRVEGRVMACVPAYALGQAPEHRARQAGRETRIHKPDPR
jgi:hypothetical protein